MYVRVISLGSNWWAAHSANRSDPYCFRRNAAWFNSAGLKYGRRLRFCWIHPGQIRFSQRSGFHPEFAGRAVGRTFLSNGPQCFRGRTHLLFSHAAKDCRPDGYLVTVNETLHGRIDFHLSAWKSDGVQPISISSRGQRYEAMLLMDGASWIESDLGRWTISKDGARLESMGSARKVAS
jgi:hypothetical protein